ncbi:hypothetical protein HK405_010938, partial [Cladochytrium tenue]
APPDTPHLNPPDTSAPDIPIGGGPPLFTRTDFPSLYSAYLFEFHPKLHCARSFDEHAAGFVAPPMHRGSSFDAYMFFCATLLLGGPIKTICWADLTRKMGYDTRNSSVAARIKIWTERHHLFEFYQYLLGGISIAQNFVPPWDQTNGSSADGSGGGGGPQLSSSSRSHSPTLKAARHHTARSLGVPLLSESADRLASSRAGSPAAHSSASVSPSQTQPQQMQQELAAPQPHPPPPELLIPTVSKENILRLYEAFLYEFHGESCESFDHDVVLSGERTGRATVSAAVASKVADHVSKASFPPGQVDRTSDIYTIFVAVKELGGFSQLTSWSNLMRRIGLDPSFSNVSTRLKHWLAKHHFFAFFDFLLGSPEIFDPYSPQFQAALKRKPASRIPRKGRLKRRRIAGVQDDDDVADEVDEADDPSSAISLRRYEQFLTQFHRTGTDQDASGCCATTIAEHLDRYTCPPVNRSVPTDRQVVFEEFQRAGGSCNLPSWSHIARVCGFDTRNSNISGRVKSWVVSNHVDAFFDHIIGADHPFLEGGAQPAPVDNEDDNDDEDEDDDEDDNNASQGDDDNDDNDVDDETGDDEDDANGNGDVGDREDGVDGGDDEDSGGDYDSDGSGGGGDALGVAAYPVPQTAAAMAIPADHHRRHYHQRQQQQDSRPHGSSSHGVSSPAPTGSDSETSDGDELLRKSSRDRRAHHRHTAAAAAAATKSAP